MICERCGCVFCWDEADEGGGPKLYCSKVCARKAGKRRRVRRWVESSLQACAEQGKQQYPNSEWAEVSAAAVLRSTGQPVRVYHCVGTDHWHLTSQRLSRA